jgi:hypothetical protein
MLIGYFLAVFDDQADNHIPTTTVPYMDGDLPVAPLCLETGSAKGVVAGCAGRNDYQAICSM